LRQPAAAARRPSIFAAAELRGFFTGKREQSHCVNVVIRRRRPAVGHAPPTIAVDGAKAGNARIWLHGIEAGAIECVARS
jgi:hypothetical protein